MWPCELAAMQAPPLRHQARLLMNWCASGFSLSGCGAAVAGAAEGSSKQCRAAGVGTDLW